MDGTGTAVETAAAAGAGVATGDAAAVEQTDDSLLGTGAEDAGDVATDLPVDPTANLGGEGEDQQADQAAGHELDPDEAVSAIPPELKHLMSDAKVAPHLQRAFNQLADYGKVGTVRDVRKFAEEFPGGVAEAVDYKTRALDGAQWDQQYLSGGAPEHADLVHSWREWAEREGTPETYRSIVRAGLEELRKGDPEGYKQLTGGTIEQTLGGQLVSTDGRQWNLAAQLDAINEAIHTNNPEALAGLSFFLSRELAALGLGKPAGARQPREQEQFQQQREQLTQQQQQIQNERVNLFNNAVNTDVRAQIDRSISQRIGELLKGTAFTEKGKQNITAAIVPEIEKRLQADRGFGTRLAQMSKEAKYNPAQRKALVDFMVNRAKALLVPVAKEIIAGKTAEFTAERKAANERISGARQRVDITGGQAARNGGARLTQKQVQQMSDADKDAYIDARFGAGR